MSWDDKKKQIKKEEVHQEEHKKKKDTEHAREWTPWQANCHNLVDSRANEAIACEVVPVEAETTAAESPTEVSPEDPGGQVVCLLSSLHAKKKKPQKALVHDSIVYHAGKRV